MSLGVPENPADYEGIMKPTCLTLNFTEKWGLIYLISWGGGIGEMSSNTRNHGGV